MTDCSGRVSVVSDDSAPYFDINTPNGSIASSNQSSNQVEIDDNGRDVLNKCKDFTKTVNNIINDIEQKGYTDRELPAFPRTELLGIMGVNKEEKV